MTKPRSASVLYLFASVGVANVRLGSLADISQRIRDVRFAPNSGHLHRRNLCLLSAISGHTWGPIATLQWSEHNGWQDVRRLGEASQPIVRRTNVSGQCAVRAWRERSPISESDNNHEESDNNHEEEEERLGGRKRRRLSLSADRCENQAAE